MITGEDPSAPSTPMTGPSPAPRKLTQEQPEPIPQLPGQDYLIPARPSELRADAEAPPFTMRFLRRRLDTGVGPRRL